MSNSEHIEAMPAISTLGLQPEPKHSPKAVTSLEDRLKPLRLPLVILLMAGVVLFAFTQDMAHWRDLIRQAGWPGLVLAVGVYGLIGASPIPSEPLTLFLA